MVAARGILWMTALLACCAPGLAAAQDALAPRNAPKAVEPPLRFRRVYAPADRVSDWPTGAARYVPVAREEFERLVVDAQHSTVSGPPSASLARAEYTASLDHAGTLQGTLLWTIERAASSTELLSVSPLGLALGETRWRTSQDPALVGLVENRGPTLVVDRAGDIAGTWALAGRPDAEGQLTFRFELPRATVSILRLSLPRDVAPLVSGGLLSVKNEGDDRQACEILFTGQSAVTVRLTKRTIPGDAQPDVFLRESLVYDISSRGIDLTAIWRLDLHATARRQLTITLDRGLQLVSARLGETEVVATRQADRADGPAEYTLELPEALATSERALRLMAVGPLVLDEPWTIPRIRARDISWQEGTCTLLVHEPLLVGQLSTADCRETKYSLLPEQSRGESFEFQLYSDRAAIEVSLTRDRPAVQMNTATSLVLSAETAQAQILAELRLASGRRSALVGDIENGWTIDGVDTVPAGNIENWNVETDQGKSRLIVTLARTLVPDEVQKLLVRAHRPAPVRSPPEWHAEDLTALRFREASGSSQFLSLAAAPPLELQLRDLERMPTVAADQFAAKAGTLFTAPPEQAVYRFTPGESQLVATLVAQPSPFTCEIRSTASLGRDRLEESYRFRIKPERDPLAQIVVAFSHARVEPVRWRLDGEPGWTLVAQRLSAEEHIPANAAGNAEQWRLTFTPPLRGLTDISATRETAITGEIPLSLAHLPQAVSGDARLAVAAAADIPISIQRSGVTPIDIDPTAFPGPQRALFEYAADDSSAPAVTLIREVDGLTAADAALVWQRRVVSDYDESGRARVRTSFAIRNTGRAQVKISTPASAAGIRVWVDGELQPRQGDGQQVTVSLPVDQAQVNLVAEFLAPGEPFGSGRSIVAEPADVDLPILDTQWLVRLPADFDLSLVEGGHAVPPLATSTIADRLLGPLLQTWRAPGRPSAPEDASEREQRPSPSMIQDAPANASVRADVPRDEDLSEERCGAEYLIHADGDLPLAVRVARTSTARSWFVASLLVTAAAGNLFFGRVRLLGALALFTAAAALLSPPALVPITSGALWGIGAVLVGRLIRRTWGPFRRRPTVADASSPRGPAVSTALPLLSVSLGLLGLVSAAVAQQSAARPSVEPPAVVHRVFIPVDDQEQPTADKYQIPEQLYDELRRRAGGAVGEMQGGMLRSARYQVSLSRDPGGETFSAGDISARFEVLVLQANAAVRIPIGAVRPFPVVRREGQAVDVIWDANDEGFVATLVEPGNYEFDLLLRPQRTKNSATGLDLPIPPVANATLAVHLPGAAPTVEVLSALGPTQLSADGSSLSARLGAADRLTLRWSKNRTLRSATTTAEADVWQWLQVQPSSVTLHARIEVSGFRTPFSELLLAVDPRLRPLPVVDRTGAVASVQSLAGDPQTVRVQLSRPVSEGATIPVSFLLTGSSGVGQLSLPRLAPQGMRVARRLLAVSVDPALQYKLPTEDAPPAITVAEFLGHWGTAPAAPQLAVQLADDQDFAIAIRPREPNLSTKQRLAIGLDDGRAEIRFDALITPVAGEASRGEILRYQLQVPANLEIEQLVLEQEGIDRISRWTRESPDEVNLFLTAPLSGRQELRLAGSLPVPSSGVVSLPQIRIVPAGRSETTVWIFRQPDVQVFVENRQGLLAADRPRSPTDPLLPGRLLTTLAAQGEEYAATLRIMPNAPRVQSLTLISIDRASEDWEGRIDYRTNVEDGCLDQITLTIPPEWSGPLEITPPGTAEQLVTTGGQTRLVVRPTIPLEGNYQLVIRCPLRWNEANSLPLPAILPAPHEVATSYALLPKELARERLSWKTEEMRAERLPEGVSSPLAAESADVYLITGRTAAVSRRGTAAPSATATTADIQVAWSGAAPVRGVARFVLTADHASACEIAVPDGLQILALRRNGLPVSAPRTEHGVWKIALDPESDRREIEIVFRGDPPGAAELGGIRLLAPTLLSPVPTRTDWTVTGPQGIAGFAVSDYDVPTIPSESGNALASSASMMPSPLGERSAERLSFAGNVPSLTLHQRAPWRSTALLRGLLALVCGGMGMILLRDSRRHRGTVSKQESTTA